MHLRKRMKGPDARSRSTMWSCSVGCLIGLLAGGADLSAQQASNDAPPPVVVDPSDHRLGTIMFDGVRIPYLDWGGTGVTLMFLAGAGNTAHVFDDFAPRFTDEFRVLGATRIGYGESDHPQNGGYDLASRVEHIRATLDREQIDRAVLIGHSLGGDEITAFAAAYPERSVALIYLDAGMDHTATMPVARGMAALGGSAPQPGPDDLTSVQAYRRYLARVLGVEFPIGEVLATAVFDSTGAYQGPRGAPVAGLGILASIRPPEFTNVQAPVLSLYSVSPVEDYFPWLEPDSDEYARVSAYLEEQLQPAFEAERAEFENEVSGAKVSAYPAHHYQFLSMPDDTERRIRAFLSSLGEL